MGEGRPSPECRGPPVTRRVLVLGGTAEARELAARLAGRADVVVTTSLAGRTRHPRLPAGQVRTGGFGGVDGLAAALEDVDVLVDATHPFAATMTEHAVTAAARTGTPLVVLRRPGWTAGPGDRWTRVPSLDAAAAALPSGARVLVATGRQGVEAFVDVDAWFLVRAIERPAVLPARHELVLARGPFALDDERALLDRHGITVVVAKDSGGATEAKLVAARERALPVLLVDRPPLPAGVDALATVDDVLARL
jgi:precorrin-6A/cobalt-precorrin-6A reductase